MTGLRKAHSRTGRGNEMSTQSFSIKEAAVILGLSERSVRRLLARKRIRAVLIGGVYRIPRAELCRAMGCQPPSSCLVRGGATCDLVRKVVA